MAEITHIATLPKQSQRPRRKRPWWVWGLWTLCGFILILTIISAVIWSNKDSLLETLAIHKLADNGIKAELDIDSLSKTRAVLDNVSLSYDGQTFFTAKHIEAVYDWRGALKGQIQSAIITQPRVDITIDKTGKIINDWLPQRQNNAPSDGILPENGVIVKKGVFLIQSPYGKARLSGDIHLDTPKSFTATLSLAPTQLRYNELNLTGGGEFNIDMRGAVPKLNSHLNLSDISHPAIDAKNVSLRIDGTPDIDKQSFQGQLNVRLDRLQTAQAYTDNSQIDWNGHIQKTEPFFDLKGTWIANLNNARIPDPIRSDDLANSLSFYVPLIKTPIAQNFVPELRQALNSLLTGSDIHARGSLDRDDAGFKLQFSAPAQIKSAQTDLTLTPHIAAPAYYFNRRTQHITAILDAAFTAPANLSLTDVSFKARSINGVQIDGVDRFSAQINTQTPWTGYGIDGRPVRLAPLSVDMHYDGMDINARKVALAGSVDYDGVLPGGYVEGLKIAGDMALNLNQNGHMTLGYRPRAATQLRIDKLDTNTEWTAHNLTANIIPNAALFELIGSENKSRANAKLSDVSVTLQRKTNPAHLNITTNSLSAKGQLERGGNAAQLLKQNWDIDFTQTLITSDDLPGPDTIITMPDGTLQASLITDQTPVFDLKTPSADIQTQLVNAKAMQLHLHGQADNYDIEHSGGRVKLTGNTLPALPITGRLNVAGGTFMGTAKARLPQADNTPITMSYNIRDGSGYADVDIDALEFTPNGLQPQNLISALRGKIAQVEGLASAKIHLEFTRGQALKSSGIAKIIDMNLGTAPGPLTGMNMELTMDSVLPLVSRGRQRITVASFDPGLPLQDGVIDFELVNGGVKIHSAKWPIGAGFFSLDPFTWQYGAEENRLVMRLADVELGEFMESMGNDRIDATGQVQGEFPIVISGVNVRVDNGYIIVKDGGTIRYTPQTVETAPPVSYTQEEAIKILRTKDQARYSSLARDTLREFKYKELSVKVNGALDGDVELGTIFHGSNSKVLNGQPFEFNINVVGELFNILRSFDSNAQIKSQLEKQGISLDGLTLDTD